MNCPHCNKEINGFTGLQEIQKFQKHLISCKKNPKREVIVEVDMWGKMIKKNITTSSMMEALELRAKSNQ